MLKFEIYKSIWIALSNSDPALADYVANRYFAWNDPLDIEYSIEIYIIGCLTIN